MNDAGGNKIQYSCVLDHFIKSTVLIVACITHLRERVEKAVILKFAWLWSPLSRSVTWDRWPSDHPLGSTSSLPENGAGRPRPQSSEFFVAEISRGSYRGCLVGGSPRPGVYSVFTNDVIDGLQSTLTQAAKDTCLHGIMVRRGGEC